MAKRTPNKKGKSTTTKKDVAEQKEVKAVETVNKKVVFDDEGFAPEGNITKI
jgi:hypothetical protein